MKWPKFELWRIVAATGWFAAAAFCVIFWSGGGDKAVLVPVPTLVGAGIGALYQDTSKGIIFGVAFSATFMSMLFGGGSKHR